MKVCVVGSGYVGLVSGACFSETGTTVTCVDVNEEKIEQLNAGKVPIFEPGLEEMIERNMAAGRLSFSTNVASAIKEAQIIFIAVGTPPRADGAANLLAVDKVAEAVAANVGRECALVLKSTVPVGTNKRVRRIVNEAAHRIHVVSNPEFLKEGDAIGDFMRPDRIVIGVDDDDEWVRDVMGRLYHPVMLTGDRIIWMDPASAELTKYVANTMLAMRISFMNEVAMLCEKVDADVHSVRKGVGSDDRIGSKFLYAGPGYGGSCFPKDVTALSHVAREHQIQLELADATDRVNIRQKGVLFRKLKYDCFDQDVRGKTIAVWGIAFKPRTDDIRESPALQLIEALLGDGAIVKAHDPEAMANAKEKFGDQLQLVDNAYDAASGADALVLVTEWREYQNPDFKRLGDLMRTKILVDGRNIWSKYGLRDEGFKYLGIGARGS